ncbi:MAG: zinc-binding alcohol dehydrogenase [Prolixibacteraceae bacterium]
MYTGKQIKVTDPFKVICENVQFDLNIEGPNDVIVKNKFSHISAGTELACLAGIESWFTIPGIPGYTSIGEIVSIGEGVKHVKQSDLVYTYGPHAAYFKIDASDRWHGVCVKVPDGTKPELAVFTHMATIAFTSIRKSDIELGDNVLVTGLGVIGNMAAQLAQLQGANVIASDIKNERIEIAKACGLKHVVNSAEEDLKAVITAATNGKMIDTYIDASGMTPVIKHGSDLMAFGGETILLGSPRAAFDDNLTDYLKFFHYLPWCGSLKGALEFTLPTHQNEFNKHSIERNAEIVMNLIKDERLIVAPCFSHQITPDTMQSGYDGLKNQPDKYIGVVVEW